jgi:predicted aspartyl protease
MLLKGAFDTTGTPTLRVKIAGSGPAHEYIATIDTGFTGFVTLPLMEMLRFN